MSRCREFYKIGNDELSCDSEEEHVHSQYLAERLHYDALHRKFWLDDESDVPAAVGTSDSHLVLAAKE